MLNVIINQRDRFRARLRDTEEVSSLPKILLPLNFHYVVVAIIFLLWLIFAFNICQEVRQLKEKIGLLTVELEKTKADNVKLYGKIRYVQDYNNEKVVSRGSKKVPLDSLFIFN